MHIAEAHCPYCGVPALVVNGYTGLLELHIKRHRRR